MSRSRKILIADPSADEVHELSRALREKGYQISTAGDGSRALEVAVLRHPDLVIFDEGCQLVQARTFLQILRTNPRTEDIPILITGTAKDAERARSLRDGYLKKPFNLDDVLGRIAQLFRRIDAARELKSDREIEGSLSQMGLADLLQVLGQNKRTGCLSLEQGEERGEVFLSNGKPVNARVGTIEGDKAFFRLITFKEGTFAFVPGPHTGTTRIRRSMEEALLEGMRQSDEAGSLRTRLPDPSARIRLASDAAILGEQHPVTAEVVRLLAEPRSVRDLLDLTTAADYEVLAAIAALLDKGIAQVAPATDAPPGGPILGPAEQHSLRARILRGRPAAKEVVGKAVLLSESQRAVRSFLARLSDLPGFRLQRQPTPELLGTWARIDFPDGLRVELCSIPGADEAVPLWQPFSSGALGALALDRGPATLRIASHLAREARIPLLLLGEGEVPKVLKGIAGVVPAVGEPKEGVRALFEAVLHTA
jgi:CheY-like chemotaxis protein